MNKLAFRAGKEAYEHIMKFGFDAGMVKAVVAAAGGPKWFTTYGLVRYIISDLLLDTTNIHFLGSSVGSWQMAAATTSNPGASIDRLQSSYCNSLYSDTPDPQEISKVCGEIIANMIGGGTGYITSNNKKHLHVITSRGRGLLSHKRKVLKGAGFAFTFATNAVDRKLLKQTVERVVFSNHQTLPYDNALDYLPSTKISLDENNLLPSLRASGSIPFMMDRIENIPGGPKGAYWDGGLTDYHITLPYNVDGIVLHPHFLPFVYKGWFDKKLPWNRLATQKYMSKVLLITPTEAYVQSLPHKQISDMKDFKYFGLDQQARIQYWSELSKRSLELGQEFRDIIDSGRLSQVIRPY